VRGYVFGVTASGAEDVLVTGLGLNIGPEWWTPPRTRVDMYSAAFGSLSDIEGRTSPQAWTRQAREFYDPQVLDRPTEIAGLSVPISRGATTFFYARLNTRRLLLSDASAPPNTPVASDAHISVLAGYVMENKYKTDSDQYELSVNVRYRARSPECGARGGAPFPPGSITDEHFPGFQRTKGFRKNGLVFGIEALTDMTVTRLALHIDRAKGNKPPAIDVDVYFGTFASHAEAEAARPDRWALVGKDKFPDPKPWQQSAVVLSAPAQIASGSLGFFYIAADQNRLLLVRTLGSTPGDVAYTGTYSGSEDAAFRVLVGRALKFSLFALKPAAGYMAIGVEFKHD
jgi:hypothetical protein